MLLEVPLTRTMVPSLQAAMEEVSSQRKRNPSLTHIIFIVQPHHLTSKEKHSSWWDIGIEGKSGVKKKGTRTLGKEIETKSYI